MNIMIFIKSTRISIEKDFVKFIFVGIAAVLIDSITYLFLIEIIDINLSKAISFLFGSVFAYVLNNFWTFNVSRVSVSNVMKFIVLYIISLCVNVLINALINDFFNLFYCAFIIATGVSTLINFLGQKFWVFQK